LAGKKLLFLLNPLFSAKFSPSGNGTEDVLLSLGNGEGLHLFTGKHIAQMTALDTLLCSTCFDTADPAVHEDRVRTATMTDKIRWGNAIRFSKFSSQFFVVVDCRPIDATDTAI
jgi:hypothetical protein